ncbi:MAG: ferritin-like domain-containing protein [Candidatus Eremiobacteraeota bacterium]|nr:ferritin-like domain-containing protein [Candidatus Eremiobacteraeota bacterium]
MLVGTPQHRDVFCRTFIDTHVPFEPAELPWPVLGAAHLARLRAFPFWSYARSIEQRAGRMVTAFARTLEDPLIREAVALQGVEETRHGRLMSHVVERYQIDVPEIPIEDPPARRDDFCIFGFGECSDSFVGFGAFALAREKGLFPEPLMAIFENVLYEEARHIAFFINWWRYEEALAGRDKPFLRTFTSLRYHVRAILGTAQGAAAAPLIPSRLDDPELDAIVKSITPLMFLEAALAENRRVMARLDRRLLKPTIMPAVATALLLGIRMLPPRRDANAPAPPHNGVRAATARAGAENAAT